MFVVRFEGTVIQSDIKSAHDPHQRSYQGTFWSVALKVNTNKMVSDESLVVNFCGEHFSFCHTCNSFACWYVEISPFDNTHRLERDR